MEYYIRSYEGFLKAKGMIPTFTRLSLRFGVEGQGGIFLNVYTGDVTKNEENSK